MANLLIGNGINRLSNYNQSWEKLLQQLSEATGDTLNIEGKPYLHVYEEVYSKAAAKGKTEDILRSQIVKQLSKIGQNRYHKQILNLPFKNIFTTNYDYGFTPAIQRKNDEREYSLKRFQEVNGKKIWHIHGELNAPASIMLGYDHYMRSIGKLQGHLKKKKNKLNQDDENWVDAFLNDDLYILGLGLDFNEIDLWWLLAYRNRKILEGEIKSTCFIYVDIINQSQMDEKSRNSIRASYSSIHSMLKTYKVTIEEYFIEAECKSYDDAYNVMIEKIKNSLPQKV